MLRLSAFVENTRNIPVNSPEYLARTLSISARWFTSTDSSSPEFHYVGNRQGNTDGRMVYILVFPSSSPLKNPRIEVSVNSLQAVGKRAVDGERDCQGSTRCSPARIYRHTGYTTDASTSFPSAGMETDNHERHLPGFMGNAVREAPYSQGCQSGGAEGCAGTGRRTGLTNLGGWSTTKESE